MKPVPICYLEIPAPDIQIAGTFYGEIFGWEIEQSNLTNQQYWMFKTGENSLMGGFDTTKEVSGAGVIIYLKVDNIPSTLTAVERAGGTVVRSKFDIGGGYGFSAIFKDPNGNHIGLWSLT